MAVTSRSAIKVDGLRELQVALKRFAPAVEVAFRADIAAVAKVVADDARTTVPVYPEMTGKPRHHPGAAQRSIKVVQSPNWVSIKGGGARTKWYPWLDFGGTLHPTGGRKNSITRERLKKGRFIYPAIDRNQAKIRAGALAAVKHAKRMAGFY